MIHLIRKFINTGNTALNVLIEEVNENVENVRSVLGSARDTGGSDTAGGVFAKLNKIISDLATHMGRWTNTRAGYIDTINTNVSSLNSRLTSTRAGYLDKLNSGVPVSTLSGKIVKSVQRGVINTSGDTKTATATITAVDVSKSVVIGQTTTNYDLGAFTLVSLTNSTTVSTERLSGTCNTKISFQVIEFY